MNRYTLKAPKTVDGKTITSIDIPDLEVDDIITLSELDTSDLRVMRQQIARTFRVDEAVIGRLSFGDFQGLIEAAVRPLPEVPGATPSPSPRTSRRSSQRT